MTLATENTVQAPSQLALDNLIETADALVSELQTITGAEPHCGQATLLVSRMPAHIWHALPGDVSSSESYTWKTIARHGTSHISAFCEHDAECPEHIPPPKPDCIYCGRSDHWSQDCRSLDGIERTQEIGS